MMRKIKWSEDMSVGVDVIDYQHRNIIILINEIFDEISGDNDLKSIKDLIEDLVDSIKEHFTFEEKILSEYNYPNLSLHVKEHKKYTIEVEKLRSILDSNKKEICDTFKSFIEYWWYSHIMEEDMVLKDFFKDRKLT